uniref:CBS domain-containing protein n=1 Tax=Arundo donax TaxID=35708 RepID=A0A0A9E3G9_ARUDO
MLELKVSSAVVAIENKPGGILTSRDILMRVIAQNLPPESTTVEKVMTQSPECATVDTPILDALHTMHDGNFLHLPVLDRGWKQCRSWIRGDICHDAEVLGFSNVHWTS